MESDPTFSRKRPRIDSYESKIGSGYRTEFTCFDDNVEIVSSSCQNEEFSTLNSDSGFNELTPPQSMEDEISKSLAERLSGHSTNCAVHMTGSDNYIDSCHGDWSSVPLGGEPADDCSSVASTVSNVSGLSDLSNISGKEWKACSGIISWVQQQMVQGINPRVVLTHILGDTSSIPEEISDKVLWNFIVNMLSEPPRREKLRHINTIEDAVRLIKSCRKIIVLTGAGVSVSCGIPDFRSRDGIYSRLAVDFPDLPDPQAMFDIHYFRRDPRPFFKFAKEIYPGQFKPSLCHRFIALLEQNGRLRRNYTQNIDTLEQVAGIKNVVQCHGSFARATCQKCGYKVDADVIKDDIVNQRIPLCTRCCPTSSHAQEERLSIVNGHSARGVEGLHCDIPRSDISVLHPIMKPDIVFFGEGLPEEFHDLMAGDKDECDLLIVVGSSLKVRPVALIPSSLPPRVPQILINRETLQHMTFDVELLGDCDIIIKELCHRLGSSWTSLCPGIQPMSEITELPQRPPSEERGPSIHEISNAPHPKDEADIEALRACWAPKVRESISARLPEKTFFYSGTHRYIFPGAEYDFDPDDEFEEAVDGSSNSGDFGDSDDDGDENDEQEERGEGSGAPKKEGGELNDPPHNNDCSPSCTLGLNVKEKSSVSDVSENNSVRDRSDVPEKHNVSPHVAELSGVNSI